MEPKTHNSIIFLSTSPFPAQNHARCCRRNVHGRGRIGAGALHLDYRHFLRQERRRHRHYRRICGLQHPLRHRGVCICRKGGAEVLPRPMNKSLMGVGWSVGRIGSICGA